MALDTETIAHLEERVNILRRRQRVLETQRVGYGALAVPAHIELELEDIRAEIQKAEADLRRERPCPPQEANPYLGLLTFQAADAARFFGRDALIADLIARAKNTPFIAVLGASGSGKSSVVRAGLLPQLQSGAIPGSERWRTIILAPGMRPLDTLAAELAKLSGAADLDLALRLSRTLAEDHRALLLACDMLLDHTCGQKLILVIDQCEEIWTQTPPEQRERFIALLLHAASSPETPCMIVLTMRADFLHRAIEHQPLAEQIERHVALVSPMQPCDLREAIMRPAESAGGTFEPGLVDELIKQVQGQPGALPLLEYTLLELWKRRATDGLMTWAAYEALGRVEGALAARADQILNERYTADQQVALRQLLVSLVQPGEGTVDTRRRALLDDLIPAGETLEQFQQLIKPLTDERLLTTGRDTVSGEETIEVSHEALIRDWPTLGRWINEARADLRFQLQLVDAAREWDENDHCADLLWSGLRLAQADAWHERTHTRLSARDQGFLEASSSAEQARRHAEAEACAERERMLEAQACAERRNARRLRATLSGGTVALMLFIALAIFAIFQERVAHANELAGRALFDIAQHNMNHAFLLAYDAAQQSIQQPEQPNRSMRAALQSSTPYWTLSENSDSYISMVWSPNSTLVASVKNTNTVYIQNIWDHNQQSIEHTFKSGAVSNIAWTSDNDIIAIATTDNNAYLWNIKRNEVSTVFQDIAKKAGSVILSKDGKYILVTSANTIQNKSIQLLHNDGKPITTFSDPSPTTITTIALSPHGDLLLAAHNDGSACLWDTTLDPAPPSPQAPQIPAHNQCQTRLSADEEEQAFITAVAWNTNRPEVILAYSNGHATIWNVSEPKRPSTILHITGPNTYITAITWSPDGAHIVTASGNRTAQVWDAKTGALVFVLQGHTAYIYTIAWSPDSSMIITTSGDDTTRVWDALTGSIVSILQGYTAVWSPDGTHIVAASKNHKTRVWDLSASRPTISKPGHIAMWNHSRTQFATVDNNQDIHLWQANGAPISPDDSAPMSTADGAKRIAGDPIGADDGAATYITYIEWSNDDRMLAASDVSGRVCVWDITGSIRNRSCQDINHIPISAIAWEPPNGPIDTNASRRLVIGTSQGNTYIWDTKTVNLQQLTLDKNPQTYITDIVWSNNGAQFLTLGKTNTAVLWSADGRAQIIFTDRNKDIQITAVAWHPNSTSIALADSAGALSLWSSDATGRWAEQTRRTVVTNHALTTIAWNPDGSYLAIGSNNNTTSIVDANGNLITTLEGHISSVTAIAWSQSGRYLATASKDNTARIWEMPLPSLISNPMLQISPPTTIAVLEGHSDGINTIAWGDDDRQILTVSSDGTTKLWIADNQLLSAKLIERICTNIKPEDIKHEIKTWRGCAFEQNQHKSQLDTYNLLRPSIQKAGP